MTGFKVFSLAYGVFAPKISLQCKEQGFCVPHNCRALQADADAITRLFIRGLLSETETHNVRKRLLKVIQKKLVRTKEETP